jgi:predicted nucleic acid-binding protein
MKQAKLPILLTAFGELELTSAIALRLFRKELLPSKRKAAQALLAMDLVDGVLSMKPLPARIFERAQQIARNRTPPLGTRTLDVLHVASALLLEANTFYTFDRNQGKLAAAEGLLVP